MATPVMFLGRVVLSSRSAHWAVVTTVGLWALAAAIGARWLEIDLSAPWPPAHLPLVEPCAVLGATVLAILTKPRFWEWDRVSTRRRPRLVAAATATTGIALPASCVLAPVPGLPADAAWAWVLSNALIMTATVQTITPLLTPLTAGGLAMLAWLGHGLVTNLAPDVWWLPLSSQHDPTANWVLVVLLSAAAVALHTWTCGQTAWAHRRFDNDQ